MTEIHRLTELVYSAEISESLKLYVYDRRSEHYYESVWFRRHVRYPAEEIGTHAAKAMALKAIAEGRQVRITNADDFLVFHAQAGQVIYPADAEAFWQQVEGR